jgi:hypothetical protein
MQRCARLAPTNKKRGALTFLKVVQSSPYSPVLGNRTVRRLLPGYVLSALGDGMAVVAVSWFAIQLAPQADREVWLAGATMAYTLPAAAGALLLGRFLRHRSPARLVAWDATLRACFLGAIPIAYAFGALDIGVYVALLGASSVLHSWGQAGMFTLLARLLPENDHLAGNAMLSTVGAFATIAGPALAAPLIAWAGPATVIAVDAGTFVLLAVTFLVVIRIPWAPNAVDIPEGRRSGFAMVRQTPALFGLLGLSFGFFLLFGTVYVALPLRVSDDLRGSAGLLAAFYTAFGIGAVAGGVVAGYLRRLRLWPTTIGIVVAVGAAILPLGLDVPIAVAVASFAIVGLLWPPYSSLSTTLIQHSAAPAVLPSMLVAASSVRVLSVPLGTAMGGPLVAGLGAAGALRLTATTVVAFGATAALAVTVHTWTTGLRQRARAKESLNV